MKTNIGWLFYKDYFYNYNNPRDIESIDFNSKSKRITNVKLSDTIQFKVKKGIHIKTFPLTTIYPGLLIGSGYQHDIPKQDKAFKLGFFFDYTTGLPVIPGSSVKGVLRDAFEKADGKYVIELLNKLDIDNNKIQYLFEKVKVDDRKEKVPFIVKHIFYGYTKAIKENNKEMIVDKELNVYQKDKFFDVFPVAPVGNKFLDDDYITPHRDPLKNPVPLRFLKVLPNVSFRFNFELYDFKNENGETILSADEKSKLFKLILKDLGIGAKTNVGYGQFTDQTTVENNNDTNDIIETANEPDFIEREGIEPNAEISCRIDKKIYRANEDLFQLYLFPYIKGYSKFLNELKKPLPSIKLKDYQVKGIYEGDIKKFIVNRIGKDGRIFFKNEIV